MHKEDTDEETQYFEEFEKDMNEKGMNEEEIYNIYNSFVSVRINMLVDIVENLHDLKDPDYTLYRRMSTIKMVKKQLIRMEQLIRMDSNHQNHIQIINDIEPVYRVGAKRYQAKTFKEQL